MKEYIKNRFNILKQDFKDAWDVRRKENINITVEMKSKTLEQINNIRKITGKNRARIFEEAMKSKLKEEKLKAKLNKK